MKLVKESISFQRGEDPKKVLGIGQRYLIEKWLEKMYINLYIINSDMTIDVEGEADFFGMGLEEFPHYIQFNKIETDFSIQNNKFTSLRGCPLWIGNTFSCSSNKLTSLEFCPKYIGTDFYCYNNLRVFSKKEIKKICKVGMQIINGEK